MPILMNIDELQVGMTIAKDVVSKFKVIMPAGHSLREEDLVSLKKHLPNMAFSIKDAVIDSHVEFENEEYQLKISQDVRSKIYTASKEIMKNIRAGVELKGESINLIRETVAEVLGFLRQNPVNKAIVQEVSSNEDYLQEHTANVFYLSVLIGDTLRHYIKRERERLSAAKSINDAINIAPLAHAAMIFDLGMVPLQNLYQKSAPLTGAEIALLKQHPHVSIEMLPNNFDPMAKLAVRCHHENMDGSGYPEGRKGSKINVFSRMLRIADAYSSATAQRVYKQAKSPTKALHEMFTDPYFKYYDPIMLKVFASIMQPIPLGARVKLNSRHTAIVVAHQPGKPFEPVILIAYDENGKPFTKEELQNPIPLDKVPSLEIVEFNGEDLTYLNKDKVDFSSKFSEETYVPPDEDSENPDFEQEDESYMPKVQLNDNKTQIFDFLFP